MSTLREFIWDTKYRHYRDGKAQDRDMDATWRRVAAAIASVEGSPGDWEDRFYELLASGRFLPGGRVLAGAGTGRRVTLFNCFVSGAPRDSMDSILDTLKETALTMQQGGGVGCDFSGLRPAGSAAVASGAIASGPVSFMHIWDAMCKILLSTSTRRGAMMATLRCDHPDIGAFIDAKRGGEVLRNFNLSVQVTDAFMEAVASGGEWALAYPPHARDAGPAQRLAARELWRRIASAAADSAEPGVLFIDRINRENNLGYRETISAANPCGEIPLPSYGACNLGSINLVRFVREPFTDRAVVDQEGIREAAAAALRFMDNVIDASRFPLERQAEQARGSRRVGLGVTGLADLFMMLGLHYDSDEARACAARILEIIRDTAYETSIALASEKGEFPFLEREPYTKAPFIQRLSPGLRGAIGRHGIRNSHSLAIAPAGSISLLAGNVSSGIEPVFALKGSRVVRASAEGSQRLEVLDRAYSEWLESGGGDLPACFVTAGELRPGAHLEMQAALQPLVDNAISKTVNLPGTASAEDVAEIYAQAHRLGLKGCTVYREGSLQGQVLRDADERRCCRVA